MKVYFEFFYFFQR